MKVNFNILEYGISETEKVARKMRHRKSLSNFDIHLLVLWELFRGPNSPDEPFAANGATSHDIESSTSSL
jgi:hypothetical protein